LFIKGDPAFTYYCLSVFALVRHNQYYLKHAIEIKHSCILLGKKRTALPLVALAQRQEVYAPIILLLYVIRQSTPIFVLCNYE